MNRSTVNASSLVEFGLSRNTVANGCVELEIVYGIASRGFDTCGPTIAPPHFTLTVVRTSIDPTDP
jgi:hypothetical protein